MAKVKIVADSTCYLPDELIKKYDIKIAPLYVRFGDDMFRERVDIKDEDFYKRIREGELPYTTQPATTDFITVYKPLIEEGYSIISPLISSEISGAVNAANAAKKSLGDPDIHIFDAKFTTLGLGYQIVEIAERLYERGMTKDEVIQEMPSIRDRMYNFFVVGDLYFLARLGRIKKTEAVLGSMIKVKPLLYMRDGAIDTLEKPRTMKKPKARMIEIAKQIVTEKGLKHMSIIWGDNKEEAEAYRDVCAKEFNKEVSMTRLGPVIASHTGPDILSLQFSTER